MNRAFRVDVTRTAITEATKRYNVLSLYYFFSSPAISGGTLDKDRAAAAKEIFDEVVVKTLAPIFNTFIGAILAWVFGKPLVASWAERLRPSNTHA